jgi:hypothetical protein
VSRVGAAADLVTFVVAMYDSGCPAKLKHYDMVGQTDAGARSAVYGPLLPGRAYRFKARARFILRCFCLHAYSLCLLWVVQVAACNSAGIGSYSFASEDIVVTASSTTAARVVDVDQLSQATTGSRESDVEVTVWDKVSLFLRRHCDRSLFPWVASGWLMALCCPTPFVVFTAEMLAAQGAATPFSTLTLAVATVASHSVVRSSPLSRCA